MELEQAALNKSVTLSLIKAMYGIMIAVVEEKTPAPTLRKSMQSWVSMASTAVKRFSLTDLPYLTDLIVKGNVENIQVEQLIEFGEQIKGAMQTMNKETDIETDSLTQIKLLGSWFRVQSERAYENLSKSVSLLEEPLLTQAFIKETRSQAPAKKALMAIVKKVTKRANSDTLTPEEMKKLKESNPLLAKEYNRIRKDFNGAWREALQTFVRESGKRLVPYNSVLKFLDSQGMKYTLPKGFDGDVDDSGKLYTKSGKMINGVPNAYTSPVVIVMNPEYNPKLDDSFVFLSQKADGSAGGYFYTTEYRKKATQQKFAHVDVIKTKIKAIRNKWMPSLKEGVSDVKGVMATVLEILLQYSARIGSKGNGTDGKPTFGISTLQVKHVKIAQNGDVTIAYKGKDGVAQTHTIRAGDSQSGKYLSANIRALVKGKSPNDPLFTFTGVSGKQRPVNATMINRYFGLLGAGGVVTVHKMRTLRGTILFTKSMEEELAKLKTKQVTETQARKIFLAMAVKVGAILGHIRTTAGGTKTKVTGATALQSYIDPTVQLQYFIQLGIRPPKYLEKFKG